MPQALYSIGVLLLAYTGQIEAARLSTRLPKLLSGLGEVAGLYDTFLIDQWGVLHDGKKLYPGVLEALEELRAQGKTLVMLSNSSKRQASSVKGLEKVGISPEKFFPNGQIVTSGEIVHRLLTSQREKLQAMFPLLKARTGEDLRIFVFGNGDDDEEYVASCSAVLVPTPREAHIVLARGTFTIGAARYKTAEETMRHVDTALLECCEAGLPMLVANPDFYRPDASKSPMPGQIASRYSRMSGAGLIQQVGKPFPLVFEEGLATIGGPPSSAAQGAEKKRKLKNNNRVCMIGDSIEHDVLGAHRFGIDSVWIQNGVHSSDLGTREGSLSPAKPAALRSFLSLHSTSLPTYILPSFCWAHGSLDASLDAGAQAAVGSASLKQAIEQPKTAEKRGEGEEEEEEEEGGRPERAALEKSEAFRAFLLEVESSMKRDTFVSILLRQPQQAAEKKPIGVPVLRSVSGRVVSLKAGLHCQLTLKYSTNDQAKNHELGAASARAIGSLIAAHGFKKAQLVTTTKTFDLTTNAVAGTSRLTEAEVATDKPAVDAMTHDRRKNRPVDPSSPFLRKLGVTTDSGRPLTGMADKLRQIERFVEVLAGLLETSHELKARRLMAAPNPFLPAAAPPSLRVVDMGSGLAYLTFAVHAHFRAHFSANVETVGVEARPQLVQRCQQIARELGSEFDQLSFLPGTIDEFFSSSPSSSSSPSLDESTAPASAAASAASAAGAGAGAAEGAGARTRAAQSVADRVLGAASSSSSSAKGAGAGKSKEKSLGAVDVLVALHACDVATDHALFCGIRSDASVIVTSPCCHKQIRPQLDDAVASSTLSDAGLSALLQHGLFRERTAEMVTDSLRALCLQAAGYETKVLEFVSGEHTAKNVMVAAVRRPTLPSAAEALSSRQQIAQLMKTYGLQHQELVSLLGLGPVQAQARPRDSSGGKGKGKKPSRLPAL